LGKNPFGDFFVLLWRKEGKQNNVISFVPLSVDIKLRFIKERKKQNGKKK
jgi:hypothetical protein